MEALFSLVCAGKLDVVERLLDQGVDPNQPSPANGARPLSGARDAAAVRLLIAYGADPNLADDKWLVTPLMSAAGNGAPGVVRGLLGAGAQVGAKNIDGATALHYAAQAAGWITDFGRRAMTSSELRDCTTTVTLLLQAGADPHVRDGRLGSSPADSATNTDAPTEIVRLLRP